MTIAAVKAIAQDYLDGTCSRETSHAMLRRLCDVNTPYPYTTELNLAKALKLRFDVYLQVVGYTEDSFRKDLVQLLESPVSSWIPPFSP